MHGTIRWRAKCGAFLTTKRPPRHVCGVLNQGAPLAGARDSFGKKIPDLQTAWAKLDAALGYADDEFSDSSYGLDSSKPEDKKKIEQVNALFSKFFDYMEKQIKDFHKILGDADKHIEHMTKCKIAKI